MRAPFASSAGRRQNFLSPQELESWLGQYCVNTSAWGRGKAKTVQILFEVLLSKASTLRVVPGPDGRDDRVIRCLKVAKIVVHPSRVENRRYLKCYKQKLADGRVRDWDALPYTKVRADELPQDAMRRTLVKLFADALPATQAIEHAIDF